MELRVELLDANDMPVIIRDVVLEIEGTTAARVVISRSCTGMNCGTSQTCLGGRCVSRRCSPLDPEACGTTECGNDDNCDAPVPCTTGVCADGACLGIGQSMLCLAGRYCDPAVGCRPIVEPPVDGGAPDASIPDAGAAEPCPGTGRNLYVNADFGDDLLTGLSPVEPFATVNRALISALEGDCINLTPGTYRDDATTRRAGTVDRPITVRGPADAILHGVPGGSGVVFASYTTTFISTDLRSMGWMAIRRWSSRTIVR